MLIEALGKMGEKQGNRLAEAGAEFISNASCLGLEVHAPRVAPQGSILYADWPILAVGLVTVAGGPGKTVKIPLTGLPFAIERSQRLLQAHGAKPMRIPLHFRLATAPCFTASYALVHHKPFLVYIVL
jgi:hypothetical protein